MDDNFYKDKYFRQLDERLDKLDAKLDAINSKLFYIYGFAGGSAFLFSLLWSWLKERIFQ